MIEIALVSGRNNDSFYFEDGQWHSQSAAGVKVAQPFVVRSAVTKSGEYTLLKDVQHDSVAETLKQEKRRADALFATLASMDIDVSISTRVLLAEAAEDLLSDASTMAFVKRRIMSWPLPGGVVGNRHSLMQVAGNFTLLHSTLHEIFENQPHIQNVISIWQSACGKASLSSSSLDTLRAELIDDGFFSSIVQGVPGRDVHLLNAEIVSQLLKPNIDQKRRDLFLTFQSELQQTLSSRKPLRHEAGRLFNKADSIQAAAPEALPFAPSGAYGYSVGANRKAVGSYESKQRVDKQIIGIRKTLFEGKLTLSERYVRELIKFQLGQDDREYAVMSLCNIASQAMDANQFEFARALVDFAAELDPNDPVAFTTRAEVFKRRGNFAAALHAYEDVLDRFPAQLYALNGKADVLHEMGQFNQAITLYTDVQKDFSDDPVAFNGHVGVLRSNGQLRESLQLAISNTKRFPLDTVTRTVLGGALASMGKYLDAARHYQKALALDKNNVGAIAGAAYALRSAGEPNRALRYLEAHSKDHNETSLKQAKAQILGSVGRVSEAKAIYESILEYFPAYTPASLGLLAIGVLQNPQPVSSDDIEALNLESEQDWIGFRTNMVALIASGMAGEAARLLESFTPKCQWLRERTRLQTALGLAQLRTNDPRCVQTLQTRIEAIEDREKQSRLLLLSHAQLQLGHAGVASTLLFGLVRTKDTSLKRMKATLIAVAENSAPADQIESLWTDELSLAMAA